MSPTHRINLTEYSEEYLDREALSPELAENLWRLYSDQVEIEEPGFKTGQKWRLKSKHWVGYIPLDEDFHLVLQPRISVSNLFRMLEYAYDLKSFRFLEGEYEGGTIEDLFERLARFLALKVTARARQGLHRDYVARREESGILKGRVDMRDLALRPWQVQRVCHYEEHTTDTEENQILIWTLLSILRSGICGPRSISEVNAGYRSLRGLVTPQQVSPERLLSQTYSRLNQDYSSMHALCRFFLEHLGPTYEAGERQMLPFLVNMASLFERFVYRWLDSHLPKGITVRAHHKVTLGGGGDYHFDVDLVLRDLRRKRDICVLDTKYKETARPSSDDISQVHTYASVLGVNSAFLVYPTPPEQGLDVQVDRRVRVRSAVFELGRDIEVAGSDFLGEIGLPAST